MSCETAAHETIQWALLKEKHYTAVRNPLYLSQVQHDGMTATWRLRVCRWMFETALESDFLYWAAARAAPTLVLESILATPRDMLERADAGEATMQHRAVW